MNKIIFEHPLNEKMRVWLRVEFLLQQLNIYRKCDQYCGLPFFHALSELLEIIERNDIKTDLVKEIELQKLQLLAWINIEGVDHLRLNAFINRFDMLLAKFSQMGRLGQSLKEDRFVASIRQRLMIPGGCCSFDLPSLFLWLQQPQIKRDVQINEWFSHILLLDEALTACLEMARQIGEFKTYHYSHNFFQETASDINLIRIRISNDSAIYPQVSGYMSRYSIRFIKLHNNDDDNTITEPLEFELACC